MENKQRDIILGWGFALTSHDEFGEEYCFTNDELTISWNLTLDFGTYHYHDEEDIDIIYDFYHLSQIMGDIVN